MLTKYFTHRQRTKQQMFGTQWKRYIDKYAVNLYLVIDVAYGIYQP